MIVISDSGLIGANKFVDMLLEVLENEGHQEKHCKLCLVRAFKKYLLELSFSKNLHIKEDK